MACGVWAGWRWRGLWWPVGGVVALWRCVVRYSAIWCVACALYKVRGLGLALAFGGVVRGVSVRCMRFGRPLGGFALPYPTKGIGKTLPWRLVPYIKDAHLVKKNLQSLQSMNYYIGMGSDWRYPVNG